MISPFVNDLHVRGCSLHCVARIQYHGSLWTPIISALSSTWGSEINRNQWPGGGGWERHVLVMSNCGIKHWTLPTIKADETSTFRNFRKFFHIVSHQGILKFAMPPVGKHKSRCKKFNSLRRDPSQSTSTPFDIPTFFTAWGDCITTSPKLPVQQHNWGISQHVPPCIPYNKKHPAWTCPGSLPGVW